VEPDTAGAYELAYREGVRALDDQREVLDNFRSRAGVLLSGAAIATSFLGSAALEHGTSVWTWLATVSFVALGAGVVLILWPRDDWSYVIRAELLIENYIEPDPLPLHRIHRDLALHMSASYLVNRGQLRVLVWLFRACSALLVLETAAWVVDLVVKG
jgi:hypothetical protein